MAYGSLVSLVFLHSSLLRHLKNGLSCKMLRFKELGGVQKFSCQTEMVATSIHTTSAYSPSAVPCFFYMSRTSSVGNRFLTALQPTAVVAWCFQNKLQPENQAKLHSPIWVSDECSKNVPVPRCKTKQNKTHLFFHRTLYILFENNIDNIQNPLSARMLR